MGFRGEALVRGLGYEVVSKKLKHLQTLFTDFNCRRDQNLKLSHNLPDS